MKATAISIRADRAYLKAVNELADKKGKHTADLVRELIDQAYGPELQPLILFFASSGEQIPQIEHSLPNGKVSNG